MSESIDIGLLLGSETLEEIEEWITKNSQRNFIKNDIKISKFDIFLMETAIAGAKRSSCKRGQVGCVVGDVDGRIVTDGYNGTIAGMSNNCEEPCDVCGGKGRIKSVVGKDTITICISCKGMGIKTNEFTIHAEQNVIANAAKKGISLDGKYMYITKSPCKTCAKLIAQSGITRVFYNEAYRDDEGITFLKNVGVIVKHLPIEKDVSSLVTGIGRYGFYV